MKTKFVLSSIALFFASVFASADTFFFLASPDGAVVNDMGLWKQLSVNKSGDDFNFYIFPKGTGGRIESDVPDAGKWAAGVLSSDQSKTVSADSDVIINRYYMGELQSDGSVKFGTLVFGDTETIVFTDSFTARDMKIRINNSVKMDFAPAEVINLNLSSLDIRQVAHTYVGKTTAGSVNINIDGDFTVSPPSGQASCNFDLGSYDGFIDSVRANNFKMSSVLDIAVTFCVHKADFASTDIRNTYNNAENGEGRTRLILNVGVLEPLESAIYSLGTAYKNADDAITVDFGMVNPESLSAGEYKIVSVDQWSEGFAEGGSLKDFNLSADVFDAYEIEYAFDWDGQNLTLTVVPEPAMFAALFGAFALMLAARRGRK